MLRGGFLMPSAQMKVYIQHTETGLYLRGTSDWVSDQNQARYFSGSIPAIDFCLSNRIDQALLLLRFGDPRYDIELRPFARHPLRQVKTRKGGRKVH